MSNKLEPFIKFCDRILPAGLRPTYYGVRPELVRFKSYQRGDKPCQFIIILAADLYVG